MHRVHALQDLMNYQYDSLIQKSHMFLYKLLSIKSTVFSRAAKSMVRILFTMFTFTRTVTNKP